MTKSNSDEDRYCERMDFPNTFNEFAEQYGFTDKEEHYTNGSQLIPVFRVKQWLNHIPNNSENMTVEQYRARMIEAFQNADCNNLIALVSLPTEKEFEHLEWLLKNYYKKQNNSDEDCISREDLIEYANNLKDGIGITANDIVRLPSIQPKPKTDVLDKIRTEIEFIPTIEWKDDGTTYILASYFKKQVLEIIDKYKAEKE